MADMMEERMQGVQVVERTLDILEALTEQQAPLTLTELVKKTGYSKTTVFRLLQTLCGRQYVEKDRNGSYSIGVKLIELVSYHINSLELQTEAKPYLATLRSELDLTAHLGVLEGCEVLYTEKMDLYQSTNLYTKVGFRTPAYCSSMGKCLLACLSGEELEAALEGCTFEQFTNYTITKKDKFKQHLRMVRRQGWAVDDQEHMLEHRCVGAPIYDYRGNAVAAISVSGTTSQITDAKIHSVAEQVKYTARQISRRLGYLE